MEKSFTPEQARELTSTIELLIKQIRLDSEANDAYLRMLTESVTDARVLRKIQGVVNNELSSGNFGNVDIKTFMDVIKYLDLYLLSTNPSSSSATLLQDNEYIISTKIQALKPACGSVRWFFTGRQAKNNAVEAYEYLNSLLSADFKIIAERNHSAILSLDNISDDEVMSDFESEIRTFREAFADLKIDEGQSFGVVRDILNVYHSTDDSINRAEQAISSSKKELEKLAKKVISKIVYDALQEIPVEELNRSKSGLKTGVLASNGYTTVADVCAASVYQLSSIRGISQDGAYSLKDKANELSKAIMESTKLKINYDSKTKETTDLLKYIYELRPLIHAINQVNNIVNPAKKNINKAVSMLEKVASGITWIFLTEADKQAFCEAFTYLSDVYSGTLAEALSELGNSRISGASNISEIEVWEDFRTNSISYYSIIEELLPGFLGNESTEYGLPEELVREIQDECFFPDGLTCELRRYQEWGVKYILHQKKALLGDEMGLGKTIQAIATMVSLKNTGETHFIVICPASVLANWCREIHKHSKLRVIKVHGVNRAGALKAWIKAGGVAVTTYETTAHFKIDEVERVGLITVDEAHYIKNESAARSKNVRALCELTDRILFMTGTALENRVEEMISLVSVLRPDIAVRLDELKDVHTAPKFREMLAPVYFRRKQADVNQELPDKIEYKSYCILGEEEKSEYESAVLSKNYALSRRVSWMMDDLEKSSKAQQLKSIVLEAAEEDRKVIVFSYFLDTVTKVKELFGDKCTNPVTGSVSPDRRQEIIDDFSENPNKQVLVAQIQSGGTGLNIQAASVVVICEPQFKPSIENQAIARAHRMGQSRSVLVYRLLCENTIDERLMELLAEKQKLFNEFADKSVAAEEAVTIDEKSFGELINEEINRILEERKKESIVSDK